MHNCKTCGGNLVAVNQFGYVCSYCGNGYSTGGKTLPAAQSAPLLDGADLFEQCVPGVLEIFWQQGNGGGAGSGYLIDKSGLAITNAHVVQTEQGNLVNALAVRICGKVVKGTLIRCGDYNRANNRVGTDLALIRLEQVPAGAKALRFEDFNNVRNGEQVYVIGNPKGEGISITSGIVSDRLRHFAGRDLMMTDCTINPGNSGGPIFNKKGLVIGTIVCSRVEADNMNFAIPSSTVLSFINK